MRKLIGLFFWRWRQVSPMKPFQINFQKKIRSMQAIPGLEHEGHSQWDRQWRQPPTNVCVPTSHGAGVGKRRKGREGVKPPQPAANQSPLASYTSTAVWSQTSSSFAMFLIVPAALLTATFSTTNMFPKPNLEDSLESLWRITRMAPAAPAQLSCVQLCPPSPHFVLSALLPWFLDCDPGFMGPSVMVI